MWSHLKFIVYYCGVGQGRNSNNSLPVCMKVLRRLEIWLGRCDWAMSMNACSVMYYLQGLPCVTVAAPWSGLVLRSTVSVSLSFVVCERTVRFCPGPELNPFLTPDIPHPWKIIKCSSYEYWCDSVALLCTFQDWTAAIVFRIIWTVQCDIPENLRLFCPVLFYVCVSSA